MAAEHVVVAFTTDSKELATTMADEVTDTAFHCCAHIEGPIRSAYRWHGRRHTNEQWRVEIEATSDVADDLVQHFETNHGGEVHDLVVREHQTHVFAEGG